VPKFTDKFGRVWSLDLDVYLVEKIHGRTPVSIDKLIAAGPGGLADLFNDVVGFGKFLWVIAEEQAQKQSPPVSPEDFARGFNGDVLEDAGDALVEALADFSPRQQRTALKALRARMKELRAETLPLALAKIAAIKLELPEEDSASSTPVTTTPTGSGSTPGGAD
jgi:hypothetical protein